MPQTRHSSLSLHSPARICVCAYVCVCVCVSVCLFSTIFCLLADLALCAALSLVLRRVDRALAGAAVYTFLSRAICPTSQMMFEWSSTINPTANLPPQTYPKPTPNPTCNLDV